MGYQPDGIGDIFVPRPPRRFRLLVNSMAEMQKAAEKFGMSLEELKARVFSKEKTSLEDELQNNVVEKIRADRILHEFCKDEVGEWPGPGEILDECAPLHSFELIME